MAYIIRILITKALCSCLRGESNPSHNHLRHQKSSFGKLAQACFLFVRDLIVTHSPYSLWGSEIALTA